jgi:hypothetical protein
MAKIKQFTIGVDNRPGAVAEIAKTLGNAKVNILSERPRAREAWFIWWSTMPGKQRRR